MMLFVVEPPMYGRDDAGTSSTMATHQPADTSTASPPASSCRIRRPSFGGPKSRYASAKAGNTRKACSILVRKPKPTMVPASTNHRVRPSSTARSVAYAPMLSSRTSSASGLSKRNISAATGVVATTAPAMSPAAGPAGPAGPTARRTAAYTTPTVATPMSASGSSSVHELIPKRRAASAGSHSEAGVLSTVM
jgi:hypothetical protein